MNGAFPETIVGILCDSSIENVVAILATWKAGAAYVPIDPSWPLERVEYILKDSAPLMVLTKRSFLNHEIPERRVIALEDESKFHPDASNLKHSNKEQDLAYIIYTSGSTGKPKGVLIEHGALAPRIGWRRNAYELEAHDVTLQFLAVAFDAYLFGTLTPLIAGARTILLNESQSRDPFAIRDAIKSHGITHFISVPAIYSAVLDCSSREDLQSLTRITLAGDSFSANLVQRSKSIISGLILFNEYGPTEATSYSTIQKDLKADERISIGTPPEGTFVLVMDEKRTLCKPGEVGELWIGGAGLARGYLNRENLTRESFVDFEEYGRMYKTGDLGRMFPDGRLEYMGRNDLQVKIGGMRLELGEIENKLQSHPQIKESVVVAKELGEGRKSLCAFIVGKSSKKVTKNELRDFLAKSFQMSCIPKEFIWLDKLPLTGNGKVDRGALKKSGYFNIQTISENMDKPSNELEEKFAKCVKN